MLAIVGAVAWHATRKVVTTAVIVGLLFLVGAVGLWDKLMQTLALMLVATLISVLIGIPLGILSARSNRLRSVLMPLLDIMQTMPSFVYLIPVLMLFGLGKVPAIFATVIYARAAADPPDRPWGFGQSTAKSWKPSTPSAPIAGNSCSACNCRWRCRASWLASTRPP